MAILRHFGSISLVIKGWNGDKNWSCLKKNFSIPMINRRFKHLFFMFVNVNIIYQSFPSFEEFEELSFATWRTLKENCIVYHGEHLTQDTDNCQARIQPSNVSAKQIWWQLQEGLTS